MVRKTLQRFIFSELFLLLLSLWLWDLCLDIGGRSSRIFKLSRSAASFCLSNVKPSAKRLNILCLCSDIIHSENSFKVFLCAPIEILKQMVKRSLLLLFPCILSWKNPCPAPFRTVNIFPPLSELRGTASNQSNTVCSGTMSSLSPIITYNDGKPSICMCTIPTLFGTLLDVKFNSILDVIVATALSSCVYCQVDRRKSDVLWVLRHPAMAWRRREHLRLQQLR